MKHSDGSSISLKKISLRNEKRVFLTDKLKTAFTEPKGEFNGSDCRTLILINVIPWH